MTANEKCQKAENIGRTLFKNDWGHRLTISFTSDQYNSTDFSATATTPTYRTYAGEIKAYRDERYPRRSDKFPDYQIDYDKLQSITEKAKESNSTPLLCVYFTDKTVFWDLSKFDWTKNDTWTYTNKYGYAYGQEKEYTHQARIKVEDAVYVKEV